MTNTLVTVILGLCCDNRNKLLARHTFDNKRDLGGGLEYIKRRNRSKTAELGMTTHSIMYLRDHELQMRFSQVEAFHPGHDQWRITLAVRELAP